MRNYRLVLLFKSDLKKEQKQKLIEQISSWVGKVENEKTNDLGGKKLAYPIKGSRNAEYTVVDFDAEKVPSDFEKKLTMQEEVLRHLLVRND